jgi:alpha-glucosidase (family GH31 glycosyl hydrolase)
VRSCFVYLTYMKQLFALAVSVTAFCSAISQIPVVIKCEEGEKWWGGAVAQAHEAPYGDTIFATNLNYDNKGNQAQPLLLSSKGRVIWSDNPFSFSFENGTVTISEYTAPVIEQIQGSTLRDAYRYASSTYFPPSGKTPDTLLFSQPQWNTWIELTYNQNQPDILEYARNILANGFKPGVIMIDDTWQEDYGVWNFHPGRFHDPAAMMKELHSMGFKVMLWVCPFVSADAVPYRELKEKKGLLRDSTGEPAMIRWWNGVSAVLDLTNPVDSTWFMTQLEHLQDSFHVDGFKLDAGDAYFYKGNTVSFRKTTVNEQTSLFGKIGLKFPLNEYRAMWKMGGQPLAERIADKNHTWEDLQKLIPQSLTQGLEGYPFVCPDMIGGGDFSSFLNRSTLDQELVVRSAQCHALMPMMQFSVAPWRVLDRNHLNAVKKAVSLRQSFTTTIMRLVHEAAATGEPVIRHMEYVFPGKGYCDINDQFMVGKDLLVAPMVTKGNSRTVILPAGKWKSDDNKLYKGPVKVTIDAPLNRLPYFARAGSK